MTRKPQQTTPRAKAWSNFIYFSSNKKNRRANQQKIAPVEKKIKNN
jgi:hypothetical protein